jgi:hypothetical protein
MPRFRAALIAATLVLAFALGCGGDAKKDANKGQDRPVPEDKDKKDKK